MRIGSVLLVVWLIIGAVVVGQRHYYSGCQNGHYHCDDYRGPAQLHRRESEDLMQNTAAKQMSAGRIRARPADGMARGRCAA